MSRESDSPGERLSRAGVAKMRAQVELDSRRMAVRSQIIELHSQYRQCMKQGRTMEELAYVMLVGEADPASEAYVRMRAEFRERHGNDGFNNAVRDATYATLAVAQAAGKDHAWYQARAQAYAGLATMEFTKAAAIMADIRRLQEAVWHASESD